MLTTETSRQIRENIVTDVNANVLAPQETPKPTLSPEAAILFNKSIIAKPLMTPEVCSLRVKDHNYRYRWVNKAARNGALLMQRRSQGFTPATSEDAEVLDGDAVSNSAEITAGDVVLMKMQAERYDAAIKWNMEKAQVLQRTRGMYLQGANPDVMSDQNATRVSIATEPFAKTGKTSAFIPDPAKIDAVIASSLGSGSANEARATVDEIRANIAKDQASGYKVIKED